MAITPIFVVLSLAAIALCQQQCYFGPGAEHRGPSSLVPCKGSGTSACCLLGDTCLSGNTCYNYNTGNLYQYGCTDISYKDSSCPYKCGWNSTKSPWTALEYCNNVDGVADTWICHAPESCGCAWKNATFDLQVLEPIGCKEMGSNARVALVAPSTLAPFVSLPSTFGGSTGYYSTTTISGNATWVSTAIAGYTPETITELTTYEPGPSSIVYVNASAVPAPSTLLGPRPASATVTKPPASSVISTTSITSISTSTAVVPAAASASASVEQGSKLSTAAQASIGVGVGIAGVLIGVFVVLCLLRRSKRKNIPVNSQPFYEPPQQSAYEEASEKRTLWPGPPTSQSASPYSEDNSMHWHHQQQPITPYSQHPPVTPYTQHPPITPFTSHSNHSFQRSRTETPRPSELPGVVDVPELATYTSRDNLGGHGASRDYF